MARAATTKPVADIEEFEDTDALRDVDNVEESILNEFRAGDADVTFSIKVYSMPGNQRAGDKEFYLFTIDPSDLPVDDRLRDDYGSGTYRARVYRTMDGKKVLFRQFDMHVLAPTKPTVMQQASETGTVLAAMERMTERFERALKEAQPQPVTVAHADPFAMLEKMTSIMKNMGMSQQPQAQTAGAEKMVEMLTKGIELGQSVNASGADDVSIGGIIKEIAKQPGVGERLLEVVTSVMQGRGVPTLPPPTPKPITQQNNPMMQMLQFLSHHATKRSDPNLYAEYFIDNTPHDIVTQLMTLPNADLIAQMTGMVSDVGKQPEWFNQFIDGVRVLMQPDSEQPEGAHADPSNAARTAGQPG